MSDKVIGGESYTAEQEAEHQAIADGRMKPIILTMTFNKVVVVPDDFDHEKHAVTNEQHVGFLRAIIKECEAKIAELEGEQCQKSEIKTAKETK